MNPSIRRAVGVFTLSFLCLACGGGGSPTEPEPPAPPSGKRFQFTMGATSAILEGALIEATVSVDGREVSRRDWSGTSGSCLVLCTIPSDVRGLSAGSHTMTFTVVRQTRNVVDYFVGCNGIVTHENGNQEVVNMPQQRARLRAGQSVTFNIRI